MGEKVIINKWEVVEAGEPLVCCKDDIAGGVSVTGRLKHNVDYWKNVLQEPALIVSIVAKGISYLSKKSQLGRVFTTRILQ